MPTPTNYVIPVSNGLLAHRERIGNAIWVFLWLIDRVTKESDSTSETECDGLVYGGAPVAARKIADELRESPRTVQAHIDRLCSEGYVKRIPHGPGEAFGYLIRKSKKWSKTRTVILPETPAGKLHTPAEAQRGCEEKPQTPAVNLRANKEDNTKQNKTRVIPTDCETFDAEPHVEAIRQSWPGTKDYSAALEAQMIEAFEQEASRLGETLESAAEYITARIKSIAPLLQGTSEAKFWPLRRVFREKAYRTSDTTWKTEIGGSNQHAGAYIPTRDALAELRAQQGGEL